MIPFPQTDNIIFDRIRRNITAHPVLLYMNGTPAFPFCADSAAAVDILTRVRAPLHTIDASPDGTLRQGLKDFADWPLLPQIYIGGTFIGGTTILREMEKSGELRRILRTL